MNSRLLIVISFIAGQAMAMEPLALTKEEQPVIPRDSTEEKVVITIQGQGGIIERKIPKRYIPLIGLFATLHEEVSHLQMSPITLVNIETWDFIEGQLERVYEITQGNERVRSDVRQEINKRMQEVDEVLGAEAYRAVYDPIDRITDMELFYSARLSELIKVVDYLGIAILKDIALDLAADIFIIDDILELPLMLRNEVIKRKVLRMCKNAVVYHKEDVSWVSVCADFIDDYDIIASGSSTGEVYVWYGEYSEPSVWKAHEGEVSSLCSSTDGYKIISCSKLEISISIWDMEGPKIADCQGHEKGVFSVYVTHDNKIVSGSEDRTVRIWNMNGNQLAVGRGHEGPVRSVYVTNDNMIVSGSDDWTLRLWDMKGTQCAVFKGHQGPVRSVYEAPDDRIVSGSDDRTIRIWDRDGIQLAVFKGHKGPVRSVCVTDDNKIVSCSDDETMRIWDMNGTELAVFHVSCGLCVTPNNNIILGSDKVNDGALRKFDTRLLDRLSVMSEEQVKLIVLALQFANEYLDDFLSSDFNEPSQREAGFLISKRCLKQINDIFGEQIIFETRKRKALDDDENNVAKKVRLEEELVAENKEELIEHE